MGKLKSKQLLRSDQLPPVGGLKSGPQEEEQRWWESRKRARRETSRASLERGSVELTDLGGAGPRHCVPAPLASETFGTRKQTMISPRPGSVASLAVWFP